VREGGGRGCRRERSEGVGGSPHHNGLYHTSTLISLHLPTAPILTYLHPTLLQAFTLKRASDPGGKRLLN